MSLQTCNTNESSFGKSSENSSSCCQSIDVGFSSSSEADSFENYLKRIAQQKAKKRKVDSHATEIQPVNVKLTKFKDFNRALAEIEKIDYNSKSQISLQEIIKSYPEITRKVALTDIAIPPSQVSMESLFSVLNLMYIDLKSINERKPCRSHVTSENSQL